MASGRFLSTSIAEDERLSKLSMMAEFIFLKTIPHLDRDGMITGRPGLLYSRVCPAREELFGGLLALIDEWIAIGLAIRFDSPEGAVLFFPGFSKNNNLPHYDRERPSKFPPPPGYYRCDSGVLPVGVEPPSKRSKSRTPAEKEQDGTGYKLQESVQDTLQDKVLENELQEQEQEQEEDQDKDQVEDQKQDEDGAPAPVDELVAAKWVECYGDEVPKNVRVPINELVAKCGVEAVLHGIKVTAENKSHNFLYIAKAARNYIPLAPDKPPSVTHTNGKHRTYQVDIPEKEVDFMPGVHPMTPPANPSPQPLPQPMALDDPWTVALSELSSVLPGRSALWLEGSEMVEGELAGEPFYQVIVHHPEANIQWLTQQVEATIRRKMHSLLRKRVNVGFIHSPIGEPA